MQDADGNLTQDGTYTYVWDAENRLTSVAPASSPVVGDKKLVFTYDYMNRRIRKRVYDWDPSAGGGSGDWSATPGRDLRFVYDGWNVLFEVDCTGSETTLRKYTWGLDLSGLNGGPARGMGLSPVDGLHGAGGIGGLLGVQDVAQSNAYLCLYDGNGNVVQLIDSASGANAARYEYDPYGNLLVAAGAYSSASPFRFSTKYLDVETGLYYYGHRYYSIRLGRWMNRDPIGEDGGENLYAFVRNQPTAYVDPTGKMCHISFCRGQPCSQPCSRPASQSPNATPPPASIEGPAATQSAAQPCNSAPSLDGHGCVCGSDPCAFIVGKGSDGCLTGNYWTKQDVKQMCNSICDNATLYLNACKIGCPSNDAYFRALASGCSKIRRVCGCTGNYYAIGGLNLGCPYGWYCLDIRPPPPPRPIEEPKVPCGPHY